MKIGIQVRGFEAIERNFKLADNRSVEEVQRLVEQSAVELRDYAKGIVPVRTGRLKHSIQVKRLERTKTGAVAEIGPHTEYESFVEFGTNRMSKRPYMRPAALAIEQRLRDGARKVLP